MPHSTDLKKSVYAIATMDTKTHENAFIGQCLNEAGVPVKLVDVSTQSVSRMTEKSSLADKLRLPDGSSLPVISRDSLLDDSTIPAYSDRGTAVTLMGEALRRFLLSECQAGRVAGVIGIGGSGGTALITHALRALEIGLPKVMVSTVASGNTAPYVDCSDITMMYSVVDIAGLNNVSRKVLANAAFAIAGMVSHKSAPCSSANTIGMTMFGVTTVGVTMVREALEQFGNECLVFHATGTGGRAMEQLVESNFIHGVIDMTTTEVADEVVGGVFPCGPQRFDRIIEQQIPYVVSVGALDMVNFGAIESVPTQFQHRKLHVHNAQVTLMRTTAEENMQFAKWIAAKLNRAATWKLLIPEKGISALDIEGGAFYDPEANAALFDTLESEFDRSNIERELIRLPYHINDRPFAEAVVTAYRQLST